MTRISAGEYVQCGRCFYYPSQYYLTKESAAKAALLLTSERLRNIVKEIARLQAEEKMVTQSLKSFQDYLDSCCAAPDNAQSNSNQ